MSALCEVGVPLASLPGEGYELMEGYYLRPLVFTSDEAGALSLAAQMFLSQASGRVAVAGQTALAKIAAVLPEATRQQTAMLLQMVQFMLPPTRFYLDDARLVVFQQAISQRRCVFVRYHSYARDETTERVVEPLRLTFSGEAWYLSAFCQLRQSERAFRLDRIDAWRLLDETFTPRTIIPVLRHGSNLLDSLVGARGRRSLPRNPPFWPVSATFVADTGQKEKIFGGLTPSGTLWVTSRNCKAETAGFEPCLSEPFLARIRFAPHVVRWVRERQHYGFQQEIVADDPGTIMAYRVDVLQVLMPWLLSWGSAAEALDPPELRDAQREEVRRLLEILT